MFEKSRPDHFLAETPSISEEAKQDALWEMFAEVTLVGDILKYSRDHIKAQESDWNFKAHGEILKIVNRRLGPTYDCIAM